MKVYLPALKGYVPSDIICTITAFIDVCYIARRNIIDSQCIAQMQDALDRFYKYRQIFLTTGVRADFNLPHQHALKHYISLIRSFGTPNGICSSIFENKHIKAVKEPWRRSSRYQAMQQMLTVNSRMDKLAAARIDFKSRGMLEGTCLSDILQRIRMCFCYFLLSLLLILR